MVADKLERIILKETPYNDVMDWEMVERWSDGIPTKSENDPENPEWKPTPVFELDLTPLGYGKILVKNEADITSNPTGTIKDRPAWEAACIHRDYAKNLFLQKKDGILDGNIGSLIVPRFTYITGKSGNFAKSVSETFRKYGLPPIKIIADMGISDKKKEELKKMYVDVYLVDLSKKSFTPEEIKRISNNEKGVDITSSMAVQPNIIFYDWHVYEAFNENADNIYIPFGSGRLRDNYLTHQSMSVRNPDPRLKISKAKLASMNILASEPEESKSSAESLTKAYNPFMIMKDNDGIDLKALSFTGKDTGIYKTKEEYIKLAYEILKTHCSTSMSGGSGFALYLQRFDEGKVNPMDKSLVVNTGKGLQ